MGTKLNVGGWIVLTPSNVKVPSKCTSRTKIDLDVEAQKLIFVFGGYNECY